jgi:hypothetical protein
MISLLSKIHFYDLIFLKIKNFFIIKKKKKNYLFLTHYSFNSELINFKKC